MLELKLNTGHITVYTDLRITHKLGAKLMKQGFISPDTLTAKLLPDPSLGTISPSDRSAAKGANILIDFPSLVHVTVKAFYNLRHKRNLGDLGLLRAAVPTISTVMSPLPLTSI